MFILVETLDKLETFYEDLQVSPEIGLDTETTSLDIFSGELLLIQLEINNRIYIFDCRRLGKKFIKYLIELLDANGKLVIMHNAKYDLKVLFNHTGTLLTNVYDTMIAEAILKAGLGNPYYSLDDLTTKYLNVKLDKDIRESFKNINGEFTQDQLIYSALDVKYLRQIKYIQEKKSDEINSKKIFNLEMRLVPVVAKMEYNGVKLDEDRWLKLEHEAEIKASKAEKEMKNLILEGLEKYFFRKDLNAYQIYDELNIPVTTKKERLALEDIVGFDFIKDRLIQDFNINSPKQLYTLLHILGYNIENTNARTLNKIKHKSRIVEILLDYRSIFKKGSSFGKNFLSYINPVTGRIHAEFNQMGTSTGRFSSDSPNLQNIVRDSEYRNCFVARLGYKIITADNSQAELRLIGAVSGEPRIIDAYRRGDDLHALTASLIFRVPLDQITDDQRYIGKTINFATIYGSTEYGLYYNFGIPLNEGKEYLNRYDMIYPILFQFKQEAKKIIWKKKYSVTPYGRKRFFEEKTLYTDVWELNKYRSRVEREGINHIIQGGSADTLKLAMIDLFYKYPYLIFLKQVHDELVIEVEEDKAEESALLIQESMVNSQKPFLGEIPAETGYKISNAWSK